MPESPVPNELLKHEREKRGWSQKDLAKKIGAPDRKTIQRWEHGDVPQPHYREKLVKLFGKSERALGFPPDEDIPFWHVPDRQNAFFTGREDILKLLHDTFLAQHARMLPQLPLALSGLGGMGKSRIALAYAYRCRHNVYQDNHHTVLWLHATSYQELTLDVMAVAQLLDLPGKDTASPDQLIEALRAWLMQLTRWLLVLDNVEDWQLIEGFLPSEIKGHVLLTTRSQSTGTFARHIPVEPLDNNAGAELVLRRAKRLPIEYPLDHAAAADVTSARSLSEEMGGLPLALDQAGAYIEAHRCSVADYLARYRRDQTQKMRLLRERGRLHDHYLLSVVSTWSLALEQIQRTNPAAIEVLQLCAFLAPDSIPEELVVTVANTSGSELRMLAEDPISFDQALGALLHYSFIQRNPETHMLTIHRLVQEVLRDGLTPDLRRRWRTHIVQALNATFPNRDGTDWRQAARFLPHALVCAAWTTDELPPTSDLAQLLHATGGHLREQGMYTEAQSLLARSLALYEQELGADRAKTAACLNTLGILSLQQGNYKEAEQRLQQARVIRTQHLGELHPDTATSLHYLAALRLQLAQYEEAESLAKRALAIREQCLEPDHPDIARTLNGLAAVYDTQAQDTQDVQRAQDLRKQAEPLYQRALQIRKRRFGDEHPETARSLNDLGILYLWQEKYDQAEPLLEHAASMKEQQLGAKHPDTALSLHNLGILYTMQGKYEQAERCLKQALRIRKQRLGDKHPNTAESYYAHAKLYERQGKQTQAIIRYRSALAIQKQRLGKDHPETQTTRRDYAALLRNMGREAEATALEADDKPSV